MSDQLIIDKIKGLARQAASDPVRAQLLAREIEREAEKLSLQHPGTGIGFYRVLRVPGIPQLLAAPASASITSAPVARWPRRALVTACYGCIIGDSPQTGLGSSSVGWQVLVKGGDQSIVINGAGADYMLFLASFGAYQNWFPLAEEVSGTDTTWNVGFRNLSTASPFTPEFYFRYIPLPDK